jgi:hypothetical protein
MSDLIDRLRKKQAFVRHGYAYDATLGMDPDCIDAANRIESLEAALREIYIAIAGGRNLAAKGIASTILAPEQDK